ncbi:MAG TPA: DinB family protein [Acidimicrobiales bacterium]|nr:DinB family protein [Acidimicrobiales bacterium]
MTDEQAALLRALEAQRRHVLGAVEGLSEEDLRRPVLPSGWSCLGLIQHLAFDVEHFWFVQVVSGQHEDQLAESIEDGWKVSPETTAEDVLDLYRHATERASDVIRETPADAPPKWWPEELFGTWRLDSVRLIVLHVISETACHAGHLDAARELIDGAQWLVLNG